MEKVEINKKEHLNYLNGLLLTRINQQKMINNTLCEMMSKNSNSESIDIIKEELNDVINDISKINAEIKSLNEEVTYSFYDKIEKDTCQNEKEKVCDEDKKSKEFSVDSRLQANKFLVDLKDQLGIPEIMIKSVSFDSINNRVSVCMYDFVADFNGKETPILKVLKYARDSFNFTVKHLDGNGKVMYMEKYFKCHIAEIYRDPIDYFSDDFSKIQLFITYQDVEYETSK